MELRINRDLESQRDVRSTATEGSKPAASGSGEGTRGAQPQAVVSVDLARRQVEAENQLAANNRVRDPAVAVQLAKQIRTQITVRSQDAVSVQTANVTPQVLRSLFLDYPDPGPAAEAGA